MDNPSKVLSLVIVLFLVDLTTGSALCSKQQLGTIGNGATKQATVINQMPRNVFAMMKNTTSTTAFLKNMNIYKQVEKNKHLPSQIKKPILKSRSSGGVSIQDMIDVNVQTCEVRPHILFLDQPGPTENALIWPFAIQVPRCVGSCSVHPNILQCVGVNNKELNLFAYKFSYNSARKRRDVMEELSNLKDPLHEIRKRSNDGGAQEIMIKVPIHEECDCQCTVTKDMCIARGQIFNEDFCQCDCPNVTSCTLPFKWDSDQCKCVCDSSGDAIDSCGIKSQGKKYWDINKCACVCDHSICRRNYLLQNLDTCTNCVCSLKSCPPGETLDTRRCRCRRPRLRGR